MSERALHRLAAEAAARLAEAGVDSPRREAWLLLAAASGRSRTSLIAHDEEVPDEAVRAQFFAMAARRAAREPLAYITGEKEFWSLPFRVEPGVLIPRPDSETLVEAVLDRIKDRARPLRILDLGTGTGCLLLALLFEFDRARGVGVDLDPRACRVAADNAGRLRLEERAMIVRGHWAEAARGPFDLVVSNPPYIRRDELAGLAPEVAGHEPDSALSGGADGLDCYRDLAPEVARLLDGDGLALFEHGHDQALGVREIMARGGLEFVEARADMSARPRVIMLKTRAIDENA